VRTSVPGGDGDVARPAVTLSRVKVQARTHWLFLLLLGGGIVLRGLVQKAYDPAIFFFDSFTYLLHAFEPAADSARPMGYPLLFLRPLLVVHDLGVIPLVQHICAVAMASGVYALLLHRGLRHWLAALAVAPVLLDGYLLQIEQNIASDTVFLTLVVGALVLLVWHPRPTVRVVAVAGLLLGMAATVRFVGGPLVLLAVVYVLLVSRGRARLLGVAAMTATAALPLLVYSAWTYQHTGEFRPGGGAMSARTLYARTVALADCGKLAETGAPAYVMRLCPSVPPEDRVQHPKPYMQKTLAPDWTVPGLPPGVDRYDALRDFGSRVVRNQPVDVTAAVLDDFANGFAWARFQPPDAWPLEVWRFPVQVRAAGQEVFDEAETTRQYGGGPPSVDAGTAWFLRDYQSVVYTRGPVFVLGVVLPLAAAAVARRRGRTGLEAPGLLVAGTALALLLSAAAYSFSWRYQLPSIPLLPWAAALGLAALWPGARRAGTMPVDAAPSADEDDQSQRDQEDRRVPDRDDPTVHGRDDQLDWDELAGVDDRAVAALFRETYGDEALAPVVVVMAANNEAGAIGGVLEALPQEVQGLPVDVLVVDDGSTDATFDIAKGQGAYVAWLGGNYGQGTALRVGYRIAREGGARYVVTTDADGQYDADDLATVLRPVVDGDADFVTGSRRLGREETTDRFRSLGVRVFGLVISCLTGARITDPANGMRAMRVEVTEALTLLQPQYQAAELLIGALARGFRVTERPTTMRARTAGRSKKGANVLYGLRFARVVLTTWRRETRRRRGRPEPAAAVSDAGAYDFRR
jgi:hypothetical protein